MTEIKHDEGSKESKFKGLFGKKDDAGKAAAEQEKFDVIDRQTEDWRNKQARGYQEHQHCSVCGRAIHLGKKYCSMECKNKLEKVQSKQGKNQKLMCCIMGAVMPIIMIVMMTMGGG